MGGYVVAHLKRDIVQLGEKVRRILFLKCICFYWFLVFLKFWIFSILNTYFSTTISVVSDLVLLSFELRILNFGFFKSHCQPLNFGFFLWSWALKTRLEGSVFFAGGVLKFSTEILRRERCWEVFRDEQRCSDIVRDVKIFLDMFRDGQKCTKKMQSSQRIWCRTGLALFDMPNLNRFDILSLSIFVFYRGKKMPCLSLFHGMSFYTVHYNIHKCRKRYC